MSLASTFTLTKDQQNAKDKFFDFLADPNASTFVIKGSAGCGKTTLVKDLLDSLASFVKVRKLIQPKYVAPEIVLTASTNKAAQQLSLSTGQFTNTIHSYLALRPQRTMNGKYVLVRNSRAPEIPKGNVIFIDEASMIDSDLLHKISYLTQGNKVVYIGDPYQLAPVRYTSSPVFNAGFDTAVLEEVVRQAKGNPILDMATQFRETVATGDWNITSPDGFHIQHLSQEDFEAEILKEFCRPDWNFYDSKILAWTNKTVEMYNKAIVDHLTGDPLLKEGDIAICNSYFQNANSRLSIPTDAEVIIDSVDYSYNNMGIDCYAVTVQYGASYTSGYVPTNISQYKSQLAKAVADNDYRLVSEYESTFIDLRASYAQTVNKSQGSTYDKVFIDLNDISRCNSGDQIARMLYVATSRARSHVYLTGDLV